MAGPSDPFADGVAPSGHRGLRPALGKADALRLTSALDDDEALVSVLCGALARLTGAPAGASFPDLLAAAGSLADWEAERCRRLAEPGEAGHRARIELACTLAELRRLA